jgi:hypothetical protein
MLDSLLPQVQPQGMDSMKKKIVKVVQKIWVRVRSITTRRAALPAVELSDAAVIIEGAELSDVLDGLLRIRHTGVQRAALQPNYQTAVIA